jgi:hypothetical protein
MTRDELFEKLKSLQEEIPTNQCQDMKGAAIVLLILMGSLLVEGDTTRLTDVVAEWGCEEIKTHAQ